MCIRDRSRTEWHERLPPSHDVVSGEVQVALCVGLGAAERAGVSTCRWVDDALTGRTTCVVNAEAAELLLVVARDQEDRIRFFGVPRASGETVRTSAVVDRTRPVSVV